MRFKIFFALLFICNIGFSQINIGKSKSPINLYVSDHNNDIFNKVKVSKTIAVVPNDMDYEKYKDIVEESWTVSEVEIITLEEYKKRSKEFQNENHIILKMVGRNYTKSKSKDGGMTFSVKAEYIFNKLTLFEFTDIKNKKGKKVFNSPAIASAYFTPNIKLREKIISSSGRKSMFIKYKNDSKNKEKAGFYNYNLGMIKNMIQFMNNKLLNSENFDLNDSYANNEKLKELKGKTLYAPEWVLRKYNPTAGKLSSIATPEEYFNSYDYNYKVISEDELSEMILNSNEDFYYFLPSQINQYKIITIYNGKTGEIIYNTTKKMSYNVKDGDFKSIVKEINKA